MTVRWTETASDDLESVYDYIAGDNASKAHTLLERIDSAIEALIRHPEMGRVGRRAGTRELILAPYIVIYRIADPVVEILNIFHGSRLWPRP